MGFDGQYWRLVKNLTVPPLSLYIHFPWCVRKCPYCDFNSHAVKDAIPEHAYIDALLDDLDQELAQLTHTRPLQSIFMGGGTPSLFSAAALGRLLQGINQRLVLAEHCEITLEANPGTFEAAKFAEFRALGINRLSIGVQSFNDQHLRRLGRIHNADAAKQAITTAQAAGFDNFNLDLMFGLPEQTLEQAMADINTAMTFQPRHVSFYQLTLEPNTYFYRYPPPLPEDDALYAMQQACQQRLADNGYQQYEISAYAQAGYPAQHNLNYWRFGDYLGIGAGAHGKLSLKVPGQIIRTSKPKHPEQYLQRQPTSRIPISVAELPLEFLMNQLRLKTGFALADYTRMTGLSPASLQPALGQCVADGLLIETDGYLRCSERGWDFLDDILQRFYV